MADNRTTLPSVGSIVKMKPSGKRAYGGVARVVDHRVIGQSYKRLGLVVAFQGREVWVHPGEVEITDIRSVQL